MVSLEELMGRNAYPGRVLVVGRVADGRPAAVYALTGRSAASRDRSMELRPSGDLLVRATGDVAHDDLRHYVAGTVLDQWTVFGNGTQVGEVALRLSRGASPAEALDDIQYEPDPPIHTPRITSIVERRPGGQTWLGTARRSEGAREGTDVIVVTVSALSPGDAVVLTTYESDGTDIRTAPGYRDVRIVAADPAGLLDEVWQSLDQRFRVAAAGFDPVVGLAGTIRHADRR